MQFVNSFFVLLLLLVVFLVVLVVVVVVAPIRHALNLSWRIQLLLHWGEKVACLFNKYSVANQISCIIYDKAKCS